ncbi:type II toxin-antitoxin system RelE/ParE family toxin [Serratia sp. JSRIV002]|uniref:type II toxin-antitoxin system RelE/ParE family toxin n=1 Tax=Serratia sp. JSRIV002 TaxID=2831894 RepID=UPI001CC0F1ED|nr:type II toxin-antitoxin system RelE/ParE family toxin [Serratia sp. JSRIV002]UAN49604.1 type II toxin-antitoxin system RelE/ParE family toxin [Serratia sp. JSRIV002]
MWKIKTTDTFDEWFSRLDDTDRASVLASLIVLREKGPQLPRPYADTVKGSRYSNMKELRVQSRGIPIRAFFAFDPRRRGILLCAGSKVGNEKRFYEVMIPIADREFTQFLNTAENKE